MRAPAAIVLMVLACAGCGNLRIERPIREQPGDWPAFARGVDHGATAAQSVTPPLTLAWNQDVTAGVGNGSPVIVDGIVFVGTLRGELYAMGAGDGKIMGWTGLGDAIQGSPAVDGSVAFVALSNSKESITAFDLNEGRARWKKNYGDVETSPLLYEEHLFIGNTAGTLYSLERATGDQRWKYELPSNTRLKGIRSSPAAEGGTVVFGADDGWLTALNAETGALRWRVDTGAPLTAAPLVRDGIVIIGNRQGTLVAVGRESGAILWRCATGAPVVANAVPAGDLVVVGTLAGKAFGIRAKDGSIAWATDLGGPVSAGGAVAGTTVYLGTLRKEIFALHAPDGTVVWKDSLDGRIRTSPAVALGRLFIATDEHTVTAFKEGPR